MNNSDVPPSRLSIQYLKSLNWGLEYLLWSVQHSLSRLAGWLCQVEFAWFKNSLINAFIYWYQINMKEYVYSKAKDYKNFNAFFLRHFKQGARILNPASHTIASPVEGSVSQQGIIVQNTLIQAKGKKYNLSDLLGGDASLVQCFQGGSFVTLYLAPENYHRVHMPIAGELRHTRYIPGFLFSVKKRNTYSISNLFTRNERVINFFQTPIGGMAIIHIGALLVGSISTAIEGTILRRFKDPKIGRWDYPPQMHRFKQLDEIGHFKLGSTVILLFEKNQMIWNEKIVLGQPVLLGDSIGSTALMKQTQQVNHASTHSLG